MGSAYYLERLLPFVYFGGWVCWLFFLGAGIRVENGERRGVLGVIPAVFLKICLEFPWFWDGYAEK